jgi:hypothetical protein
MRRKEKMIGERQMTIYTTRIKTLTVVNKTRASMVIVAMNMVVVRSMSAQRKLRRIKTWTPKRRLIILTMV